VEGHRVPAAVAFPGVRKGEAVVALRGCPPRAGNSLFGGGVHLCGTREADMNWEQIKGNWKQLSGVVKQQWGKLTDDDLAEAEGNRELLVGRIQERYGITKEEAEGQVRDWEGRL
jgi:uncharacterized protein YjbJ (UPF0337 family)